jgi:hypothetical protein
MTMKALLVAIPVLFVIFLIVGYLGNAGLGDVELGIMAALVTVWVVALVVHLWRGTARR